MSTRIQRFRSHCLLLSGFILVMLATPVWADPPLHQFTLPRAAEGHSYISRAIAFSHDGSLLAVASHDRVFVYEMTGGRLQGTYRISGEFTGDMLYDVAFNPEGTQVHALRSTAFDFDGAGIGEGLQAFESGEGINPGAFPGLEASVEVLTWVLETPNEAPQAQRFTLEGALSIREVPNTCDFSPTQNLLAVCTNGGLEADHSVYLFDLETSARVELESVGEDSLMNFHSVSFTGDGKYLIAVGSGAIIWEVATGNLYKKFDADFQDGLALLTFNATLTEDYEQLLAVHPEGYTLWSLDTLQRTIGVGTVPEPNQPQGGTYTPAAFSSDARTVAILSPRGQLQMWDSGREQSVAPFWAARNAYQEVAISPSGELLAMVREDQSSLFVWQVPEEAVVHEPAAEEDIAEEATEESNATEPPAVAEEEPSPRRQPARLEPIDDPRTWTIDGQPVEAALVRAGSISIVLVTAEGEVLRMRHDTLSEADESYLEGLGP